MGDELYKEKFELKDEAEWVLDSTLLRDLPKRGSTNRTLVP